MASVKQYIQYGSIAIILIGIGLFLTRTSEYIDRPRAGESIIAFGDSLIGGVGATSGRDLPALLSEKIGIPVINEGKRGDTTATAMVRLQNHVLAQNPRIVIILLGGNDAIQRIPPEETFKNLGLMIDRIHAQGAGVLLLGVRGGILSDKYKASFATLAKIKKVSFVPDILEDIFTHSDLMYDSIHPNDQGYAKIAEHIAPILQKMLK